MDRYEDERLAEGRFAAFTDKKERKLLASDYRRKKMDTCMQKVRGLEAQGRQGRCSSRRSWVWHEVLLHDFRRAGAFLSWELGFDGRTLNYCCRQRGLWLVCPFCTLLLYERAWQQVWQHLLIHCCCLRKSVVAGVATPANTLRPTNTPPCTVHHYSVVGLFIAASIKHVHRSPLPACCCDPVVYSCVVKHYILCLGAVVVQRGPHPTIR